MTEQPSGWPDGLMRLLTIVWPKAAATKVGDTITGRVPSSVEVELFDWETGLPLITTTELRLTVNYGNPEIVAELTMLTDVDGLPLIATATKPNRTLVECYDENGEVRTGRFRWTVAEMRTAEHGPGQAVTAEETPAPCPDCGGSRECARCEGHGHLDGERCPACESLGTCAACRIKGTR